MTEENPLGKPPYAQWPEPFVTVEPQTPQWGEMFHDLSWADLPQWREHFHESQEKP
jgi:hypothetical protein